MDYLGLLCLGFFVGAVATIGLSKVNSLSDAKDVALFVLPAVLAGAAIIFTEKFRYSPALGAYTVGLVISIIFAFINESKAAIGNCSKTTWIPAFFGVIHLAICVAAVIFACYYVLPIALKQRDAELALSDEALQAQLWYVRLRSMEGDFAAAKSGETTVAKAAGEALSNAASAAAVAKGQ